ncbi:MAG: signal peptide peptidase SppA [Syntrophobacteraceae bacterium]|jgi:protease-4|nr:signal peptide peptidase SppA [Syntrophobacteraceae bacterium]
MKSVLRIAWLLTILPLLLAGCIKAKFSLFPDSTEPLEEYTLEGSAREKILVVPLRGVMADGPRESLLRTRPSMVQEVVSHLRKAEEDKNIKALLLKVDSPGGTVTASDLLYHEIMRFKERSGAKVVAALMGIAASGGYYAALSADVIVAHPTTITGSIGVIFLKPKVTGLMEKIGLDVEVDKSGRNKDMGSPFRRSTEEEREITQSLIDGLAGRFLNLVESHRPLDPAWLQSVASARVYLADEALRIGLVDQVGYLDEAVDRAKALAGLPENARVVVYRRTEQSDDNVYNSSTALSQGGVLRLLELGMLDHINVMPSGFYYLWIPAASGLQ